LQIWEQENQWQGFIICIKKTAPKSYPVLLTLPPNKLEEALGKLDRGHWSRLGEYVTSPAGKQVVLYPNVKKIISKFVDKALQQGKAAASASGVKAAASGSGATAPGGVGGGGGEGSQATGASISRTASATTTAGAGGSAAGQVGVANEGVKVEDTSVPVGVEKQEAQKPEEVGRGGELLDHEQAGSPVKNEYPGPGVTDGGDFMLDFEDDD
jgi:hypothetical protein